MNKCWFTELFRWTGWRCFWWWFCYKNAHIIWRWRNNFRWKSQIELKLKLKNIKKQNIQTKAFRFNRKALWAEKPRSSGGFFLTKLVALFDLGVLTGVVALSSLVCNETIVPLGVILLLMTDGDVSASSTASWCLKKKL